MPAPGRGPDAAELVQICAGLGLGISERTAHRVLAGQLTACTPPLKQLTCHAGRQHAAKPADLYKDGRGLKIAGDDLARFSSAVEGAFAPLAQRYYLGLAAKPKVRVGKDSITVTLPIEKQ